MKKLLLILFLFAGYTSFSQGKIGSDGNVIPTGNYPIVASKDIKGGLHKFQTIIERDALPANYRDTGMLSYVVDSLKFYYLKDGIGNSNWQELTLKSAGGYFATNHPYPVQTIVEMLALDTAKVGDIAIVADSSKSYVLSELPSSVQANWLELLSPVLANTDYLPEGSTHLYSTTQRIRNAINADWGITYDNTTGKIKADSSALKDIFYNKDSIDAKISRIETGSGGGTGSVTSVAKGYGILQDGTITTTGTITVDSAALASKFKRITDSTDVSMLNGGKIDTSHLPVSKLYIQQAGAGETHIVRAANDTALSVSTLKNTDDITPSKNSDSSVSFNFTHPHYTKDQVDSIKATMPVLTANSPIDIVDNVILADTTPSHPYGLVTQNQLGSKSDTADLVKFNFNSLRDGDIIILDSANNEWVNQRPLSLTTTGSSGAATLIDGVLNIPNYEGGGGESYWVQDGSDISYVNGNVSIGSTTPYGKFQVVNNSIGTTVSDTSGIVLRNYTPSTSSTLLKNAPSLSFVGQGWNATTSLPNTSIVNLYTAQSNGVGGGYSTLNLRFSKDSGATYTSPFSFGVNGTMTAGGSSYGPNASIAGQLTVANQTNLSYKIVSSFSQSINSAVLNTTANSFTHNLSNVDVTPRDGEANNMFLTGTINTTNGTTKYRSLYIKPVVTSSTGLDLIAIQIDDGRLVFPATNTATGTTGAQTINKISGKVNFAAGAQTLVVTNSLVTESSIIIVTVEGTDATALTARVTPSSGSFTITLNAAATAETTVSFIVIN